MRIDKKFALLAALLISGCAASANSPGERRSQRASLVDPASGVERRAQGCLERADAPGVAPEDRDLTVAACKTAANREMDLLAARQREDYQSEVQENRGQSALMMTLTATLAH